MWSRLLSFWAHSKAKLIDQIGYDMSINQLHFILNVNII